MLSSDSSIVALDVGAKRIGVAAANAVARIASPRTTLEVGPDIIERLTQLFTDERAAAVVVGLPRNLNGDATEQTRAIQEFVKTLQARISLPLYMQDEAVTSRQAEAELQARGVQYKKGDIDALAATYILEDFLQEHPEIKA